MIVAENVEKSYKGKQAIKDISFNVDEGEIFGLIGPDGAGKTTLIRIVATLLKQDSGNITVSDLDVIKDYERIRNMIGYVPGKFSLYQDLTVEENIQLFATIFGTTLKENYYLIEDIYQMLEPFKDRPAGNLSGGMKQKLALSCALIHKPRLLLLDEPTTGVDPVSRKEFWEMLSRLKKEGITILVSTPYMDEASRCERVALIQSGRIMAINTPNEIIRAFRHKLFSIKSNKKISVVQHLRSIAGTHSVNLFGDSIHYVSKSQDFKEKQIEDELIQAGFNDVTVKNAEPEIEDCFMDLMKMEETHGN